MSWEERRSDERRLLDAELSLRDASGRLLDAHARAQELSLDGFRAQTRCGLRPGEHVHFTLTLDAETQVRGEAVVAWSAAEPFGPYSAGARITRLRWRDRGRLRRALAGPAYDFARLVRLTLRALYWIVIALGLHNIAFHQPALRRLAVELIPVLLAVAVMGWSLHVLLVRKSE